MNRELDGVYFRVERDGRYQNICFSDLTPDERAEILNGRSEEWLRNLCIILADTIKHIGDALDIVGGVYDE